MAIRREWIALGNGHGKLLQNIEEAAVRDLVPVDRRRLRFGNNIANSSVHFLHGIRFGTGDSFSEWFHGSLR